MTFNTAWDETKPAGSRNLNLGDDDIREFKEQVRERMAVDHAMGSSDDSNTGYHKKSTYINQGADPSAVAAAIIAYAKSTGGKSELFVFTEDGNAIQLTRLGKLFVESLGISGETAGDLIHYSGGKFTRLALGSALQRLRVNSGSTGVEWATPNESAPPRSSARNLRMTTSGTHQATVTADELVLQDTSGNSYTALSFSKTVDLDTAGAGGVSTGSKVANTIYNLWAVRKSSDGTTALVAALTSKTLSDVLTDIGASYNQGAIVSVLGLNNSSAVIGARQQGRRYSFETWGVLASANTSGFGSWTAIDLTPANMTTNACFVPTALSDHCYGSMVTDTGSIAITNDNSVASSLDTSAPNKFSWENPVANTNFMGSWQLDVLTTDTLYWASDQTGNKIYLAGFELNKLFT